MDPATLAGFGVFSVVLVLFLILLAVLWFFVPFLIMGTNGRLTKIIQQNARLIELLEVRKTAPPAAHPSGVVIGSQIAK